MKSKRLTWPAMAEGITTMFRMPQGTDLVEWYFARGWTYGLP
jgi:hypothetical protein